MSVLNNQLHGAESFLRC